MLLTFLKKHKEDLLVLFLLFSMASLRFIHLSYSDYISDEPGTFLFRGLPHKYNVNTTEFFLTQRKGPIQILIGFIPYFFVGGYSNELAQRIPFALFNTFSVIILYFLVKRLTKSNGTFNAEALKLPSFLRVFKRVTAPVDSRIIGFFAALLFGVNGFITAFGRVAQYQSLNMFFSFAALWFYSHLLVCSGRRPSTKVFVKSLFGTLCYSISILSHWDAIYVLPVIIFIFVKFLLDKTCKKGFKIKLLLANFAFGCLLLLPFLVPYISYYKKDIDNQEYLSSRVGLRESFDNSRDVFRFKLYNPFVTFEFYLVFTILGILVDFINRFVLKKNMVWGVFSLWFIFVLIVFKFFIHHSGTHIYNLVIPAAVLCAIALGTLVTLLPKLFKIPTVVLIVLLFVFFYYQTYLVFVDHKIEYPWSREKILGYKTREYTHEDNIRHLIGFPLRRNWKYINAWIIKQNVMRGEKFGYVSNEDKGLTGFYMRIDKREQGGFYVVGVKKPLSFRNDYKMSHIKNKRTVHKVKNEDGETIVRIYRVEDSKDD